MKVTPGISFAIPSDRATEFLNKVNDLRKKGKPTAKKFVFFASLAVCLKYEGLLWFPNPEIISEHNYVTWTLWIVKER